MTHPLFQLPSAPPTPRCILRVGGIGGSLALVHWVLYMIWRDKGRGVGNPKPHPPRGRKVRKRTSNRQPSCNVSW